MLKQITAAGNFDAGEVRWCRGMFGEDAAVREDPLVVRGTDVLLPALGERGFAVRPDEVLAVADLGRVASGLSLRAGVFNGNGRGEAQADRHFDNDPFKNFFLHLSRDLTGNVRLGALGLVGRAEADGVRNRTTMLGVDATVSVGPVELNGQYLYREDDSPTFDPNELTATMQGGFAELLIRPTGSRWYGFGLYNRVTSDRPLLDVRLGTAADITRYETVSAGIGRLERRNFRWTAEATRDRVQKTWRWTLGIVTAF